MPDFPAEGLILDVGGGVSEKAVTNAFKILVSDKDVKAALIREFETNMQQNSYLLGQIYLRYQVPEDLAHDPLPLGPDPVHLVDNSKLNRCD